MSWEISWINFLIWNILTLNKIIWKPIVYILQYFFSVTCKSWQKVIEMFPQKKAQGLYLFHRRLNSTGVIGNLCFLLFRALNFPYCRVIGMTENGVEIHFKRPPRSAATKRKTFDVEDCRMHEITEAATQPRIFTVS